MPRPNQFLWLTSNSQRSARDPQPLGLADDRLAVAPRQMHDGPTRAWTGALAAPSTIVVSRGGAPAGLALYRRLTWYHGPPTFPTSTAGPSWRPVQLLPQRSASCSARTRSARRSSGDPWTPSAAFRRKPQRRASPRLWRRRRTSGPWRASWAMMMIGLAGPCYAAVRRKGARRSVSA